MLLMSSFYFHITGNNLIYFIYVLISMLLLLLSAKLVNTSYLLIFFLGLFFLIAHFLYLGEISYGVAVYYASGFVLGLTLSRYGISKKMAVIYVFITNVYFIYLIYQYFTIGLNLNTDVFFSNSSNYVSVYVIAGIALLHFSKVKASFFWIALTLGFFITFWSGSRSGILVYTVLLLYFLLKKSSVKKKVIGIILFFSIIYAVFNLIDFSNTIGKFEDKGLDGDGRDNILSCYISHTNFLSLLVGNDSSVYECFPSNKANPHNSLISAHMWIGGFSFIIILLIVYCLYINVKNKRFDIVIFLLVFLVRGSTDVVFFFQPADFIFWYLIFTSFKNQQLNFNNHNSLQKIY